jgi:hypothetical protein
VAPVFCGGDVNPEDAMYQWAVDFIVEPGGREATEMVEACTSREAMILALTRLELAPGELLHTLSAHIGAPQEVRARRGVREIGG